MRPGLTVLPGIPGIAQLGNRKPQGAACVLAFLSSVRASSAEDTIKKRLTALSTGLAPSRIRPYIMMVKGESEPTSISVVLKFSKDIRKEIAAAPTIEAVSYTHLTLPTKRIV